MNYSNYNLNVAILFRPSDMAACALSLHKARIFLCCILGLFWLSGCYSSNPLRLIEKQKAEAIKTKGYYHVIEKSGDKYVGVTRYTKEGETFFPADTLDQVLKITQDP